MSRRAANWEYLFNPATGYIQARGTDGSFPPGAGLRGVPARARRPDGLRGGQRGPVHVVRPAGPGRARRRSWAATLPRPPSCETFFSSLNATRDAPYDWSGNEPGEWAPWEFDYFGAPDADPARRPRHRRHRVRGRPGRRAGQRRPRRPLLVVRVGGPRPLPRDARARPNLALASPLFPSVTITLPDGHRLVEQAPAAAASRPVRPRADRLGHHPPGSRTVGLRRRSPVRPPPPGAGTCPGSRLPRSESGGTLHYTLSGTPDAAWASVAGRPPSVVRDRPAPRRRILAAERRDLGHRGQSTTVQLGMALAGDEATTVHWQAVADPSGLTVAPSSGTLALAPAPRRHRGARRPSLRASSSASRRRRAGPTPSG